MLSSGYSLDAVNIVVRDYQRDGSLDVELFYADDVFDANYPFTARAPRLTLIDRALKAPDTPLGEIDMLSDADRADWTRSPRRRRSMLISRRHDGRPLGSGVPGERPAVVSADGTLRYAEFDAAVNHIAEVLRARIERDESVAVIVPRSPEMLVAIHGILRAGAAYVPIDPEHPTLRIRTILEESGARAIVAGAKFAEIADELGVIASSRHGRGGSREPAASPEDLAYVIYTSGSTGRPKGVMVEHRSVVNRLRWMQRRYPLGADDVILQKTPVTFDVSVWELMWWAMAGASVALRAPGRTRPAQDHRGRRASRVTVMHFVPSMLGPFLDQLEAEPDDAPAHLTAHGVLQRRSADPALVERFNRLFGARRAAADQPLRPDRGDGRRELLRLPHAGPVERCRSAGRSTTQHCWCSTSAETPAPWACPVN